MGQHKATCRHTGGPVPAQNSFSTGIPLAMPAVGQQCRLDARSGPDLSAMWVVGD